MIHHSGTYISYIYNGSLINARTRESIKQYSQINTDMVFQMISIKVR